MLELRRKEKRYKNMEKTYTINGMSCVICKNTVEKGIKTIEGVFDCKVNLLENEALVNYDENIVNDEIIAKKVSDLGYELVLHNNTLNIDKVKMFVSLILVIILMYFSMGPMLGLKQHLYSKYYQLLLSTIIIIINIKYYTRGLNALIHIRPNMDSLVSISSFVSYLYSILAFNKPNYHLYFETSAMVLVIVSIGKYIEGQNKNKTTKTIRGLATLIPMQANLIKDDKIIVTKIDDIKINDIVLVKAGESIPQDGIIIEGESQIDESLVTGESLPLNKSVNDEVIGGTVNIDGQIKVKITKANTNSTISKIISLTKQATLNKIPIERLCDKISKYFVYGIISIALITFILWMLIYKDIELALNFSLSVLVISCPCALGLATPSAIMVSTGVAAKNGVLIKNIEILEIASKLKNIIFDKTGTLTSNSLQINSVKEYDKDFINVLSSLERLSNHPIAKTINSKYKDGNIKFEKYKEISAKGIVGYLKNDIYYAGNYNLVKDYLSNDSLKLIDKNHSYIVVGKNDKLLGIVYLSDKLKESSIIAISKLNLRNINTIMATGDNEIAARSIAERLSINKYYYGVNPEEKNKILEENKKTGLTAMVGDGINDAISLTSADVSFAMANGTDIAYATSDVVLMSNNINDIIFVIDLADKTMRIIKQNLFWALFYNSLFIPIAAGILYKPLNISLNPMISAITMCISSIIVLTNALRINSVTKEEITTMNKTVTIEGMMCKKCEAHAKAALEELGANVSVSLEDKKAYLTDTSLSDEQIKEAIKNAGYEVVDIISE